MNLWSPAYRNSYRKTFLLAYPVVFSQLGHILVGIVDTAMVGQIGSTPQAAVALANSIYTLVLVFGIGVSYGITPLVAAEDGAKNAYNISALLKHGIWVNTLLGVALFSILFCISPVLRMFQQKEIVVAMAIPFLNVMILGMIPLCFFFAMKQFAEGLSFTKIAMFITLGANAINIFLNYTMIYGHFGFPKLGLMGSCWASFISRIVMALAMFGYVYYNKNFKPYWQQYKTVKLSGALFGKILKIGVPSGLQWVFEVGAFAFAVIMIGWINEKAQAAHQIALCMAATTYMMASGLSAAASVRVGNQFGKQNREGVRVAGFSAFTMVLLFMGFSAIGLIALRNVLPLFFTIDDEVINIASALIVIAAFFQLSDGTQVVGLGALRGIKDTRIPTFITLIAYWIIGLPLCYWFAFTLHLGVNGIWYGLSLGLTTAAILLFWRFNYVTKRLWKDSR